MLWVLTRDQNPSEAVIEKAEAVIDANNLNKTFLLKTKQTDCDDKEDEPDTTEDGVDDATTVAPEPAM